MYPEKYKFRDMSEEFGRIPVFFQSKVMEREIAGKTYMVEPINAFDVAINKSIKSLRARRDEDKTLFESRGMTEQEAWDNLTSGISQTGAA